MKKSEIKFLGKSAKKQIQKEIKTNLITHLEDFAKKFNQDSKKFAKAIKKGSDRLSKKISKQLKIDQSIILQVADQTNTNQGSNPASGKRLRTNQPQVQKPTRGNSPQRSVAKVPAIQTTSPDKLVTAKATPVRKRRISKEKENVV